MPIVLIDGLASWLWQALGNADPGLLLMGTSTALVCAYVIRFLAISIGGIEAGLARIPPSMAQADRQSVVSGKSVSVRVDLGGPRIITTKTSMTTCHQQHSCVIVTLYLIYPPTSHYLS